MAAAEIYAFQFSSCVFEEGMVTRSLHATKRGAYRAMNAYLWAEHEDFRRFGHKRIIGRGWKPLQHAAWQVRPMEVLP